MNEFDAACELMQKQLGHDVQISLATCNKNNVSVRIVDGYYKDGCIYVVTHTSSHKMKQISLNSNVAVCKDLFQGIGKAENLGNPKEIKNQELAKELREVFIIFYDRHVDEDDPGTCILKINLTEAVVFDDNNKYSIDYLNKTAKRYDFHNDIITI
ncbi:MAG: pyridoxamine 5'-phosphate oxidase family protein [Tissierellaceae bacterium]|nr:pyridoxamine 5'-phosphate oxidase family protein [Tissierellaceae bacterium]